MGTSETPSAGPSLLGCNFAFKYDGVQQAWQRLQPESCAELEVLRLQLSITNLHLLQSCSSRKYHAPDPRGASREAHLGAPSSHMCNPVQVYNPVFVGPPPNVCSNGCDVMWPLPLWPDSLCCNARHTTWPGRRLPLLLQDPALDPATSAGTSSQKHLEKFADIGVNLLPIVEESIRGEM